MTLRYAHLSPRYLADEVKALDRFQQDGKPQTKSDAEQAGPPQKDQSETESAEPDSAEDSSPPAVRAAAQPAANGRSTPANRGSRCTE